MCYNGKPYTILYYIVDSVNTNTEMQTYTHNKTANMLPTCSRIPILLQLHPYKQCLANLIISINLELLYIYIQS